MTNALDLTPFRLFIQQRCGLVFDAHSGPKLAQALAQRAQACGLAFDSAFIHLLENSASEFQQLVNLLTNNETYFFREPEQLQLLVHRLVPRLLAQQKDRTQPLRILSAGCATGEEPYSLVMALTEAFGNQAAHLFRVSAWDIDSHVLAKARRGHFCEFSFRGVSQALRDRYFVPVGDQYHLRDDIRSQVTFHAVNLLSDAPPWGTPPWDIIFFRNVSIYFNANTRNTVQSRLSEWLQPAGCLVVGSSETLSNNFGNMSLVEEEGLFYFSKHPLPINSPVAPPPFRTPAALPICAAGTATLPFAMPVATVAAASGSATGVPGHTFNMDQIRLWVQDKRFKESAQALAMHLVHQPDDARAMLLQAYILLHHKDFVAAHLAARQALQLLPWSADALLLLGVIAKWQNVPTEAVRWLKQAVYAHHECWPAHYYLAELYSKQGSSMQAARAYRVVLQLLAPSQVPNTGILTVPLDLPAGQIAFLCHHALQQMDAAPLVALRKSQTAHGN